MQFKRCSTLTKSKYFSDVRTATRLFRKEEATSVFLESSGVFRKCGQFREESTYSVPSHYQDILRVIKFRLK